MINNKINIAQAPGPLIIPPVNLEPETNEKTDPCFSCEAFDTFVKIGSGFTESIANLLSPGMYILFSALVGVWIVWQAALLITAKTSLLKVGHEFIPIVIASILLGSQGTSLVVTTYELGIDIMAKTSSIAFTAANESQPVEDAKGIRVLIQTAELGIGSMFKFAQEIIGQWSPTNWMPLFYGLAIIIPYFLLIVSYLAQVIVAMFRMQMIAILSPFLMMAFGFNWGRQCAIQGIKTFAGSIFTLFASTCAISLGIYAAKTVAQSDLSDVSLTDTKFLLAVSLGIMGSALMTEGVSVANSILGTMLTNTAAGIMTAGALGTAGAGAAAAWRNKQTIASGVGKAASLAGGAANMAGSAIMNPSGAGSAMGGYAQNQANRLKEFWSATQNSVKPDNAMANLQDRFNRFG